LKKIRAFLIISILLFLNYCTYAQTLTYQFIDPCTNKVSFFSVPATGTVIFFLNRSANFTSSDVANGTFANWVNQVYVDYRKITPCSVQSGQITQNQITSQIISNTVQSVVSSIMGQAQSAAGTPQNGDDPTNNQSNSTEVGGTVDNVTTQNDKSNATTSSGERKENSESKDGSSEKTTSKTEETPSEGSTPKPEEVPTEKGSETVTTVTVNTDTQNQGNTVEGTNGGEQNGNNEQSGGKQSSDSKESESSNKSSVKSNKPTSSNPMIINSDLTTAQNLDKTFTPILNLGMSQSSMTGMSSWGVTTMIWFNLKQFAISGKYTKIHLNKSGKLKWINNFNLTMVYTYGNMLGFIGYSGILNAGKWGVTGFNLSGAATLVTMDKSTFISPSITAFYTKPFLMGKRIIMSPEIYIMSTPIIYSTRDKVTTSDRTFSAFMGTGIDYKITRRFKLNINYKLNMSTNPKFPVLSFFLIGSKVNL
jgi:hypothetical protein